MIDPNVVYEGREPTYEERKLLEWAEGLTEDVKPLKEAMSRLATLDAAILAGSVGLFGKIDLPGWSLTGGVFCLLVSLLFAIVASGMLPVFASTSIAGLKWAKSHLWKQRAIASEIASWSLYAGLMFFAVGVITR